MQFVFLSGCKSRYLSIVGIAALASFVVFAAIPRSTIFMHVLHKTGHPLAFGSIAILTLLLLQGEVPTDAHRWRGYAKALLISVAIGGLTELAQLFTNRGASMSDVGRDLLGAVAGLGIFSTVATGRSISSRSTLRQIATLIGVFATIAAITPLAWCATAYLNRDTRFPILLKLQSPLDEYFVSATGERTRIVFIAGQAGNEKAYAVTFEKSESAGVQIDEPHADWRGYRQMVFELTNPGRQDVQVTLRVLDRHHNWETDDRFNSVVTLKAMQRRRIVVALRDIEQAPRGRLMDMDKIANVAVFVWRPEQAGQFLVHRIALE